MPPELPASAYLRRLGDRVPSMLAYWDRELACRYANRAYEHWFGVSPERLIGTTLRELLGPERFARNEPCILGALRGEEQTFERMVPGPGGTRRRGLAHDMPDRDEQGTVGVIGGRGGQAVGRQLARAQVVVGQVMASIDNTLARLDVDIDTLVAVVVADMPLHERPRIHIERATPTRTASMDMNLVRLALRNLLVNALRCSPPAAPVVIRITDSDDPLALVIDVVDVGGGIEASLVPELF